MSRLSDLDGRTAMRVICGLLGLALAFQGGLAGLDAQTTKAQTITGVVKTVSGSSLTVATASRELTFVLDNSTRFTGKGLARDLVLRDREGRILQTVKPGDRVTVAYRVFGDTMNAVHVTVQRPQ
jgi:hypothetical protein